MVPLSTLTVREKAIIRGKPIDLELDPRRKDFEDSIIPPNTPASYTLFMDIINSAPRDEAVQEFIENILCGLASLPASRALPSRNTPSLNLRSAIMDLEDTFKNTKRLNTQATAKLLKILVDRGDDELIWSAVYDLVSYSKAEKRSLSAASDPIRRDLHQDWHRTYLRDSLDAL
ncbi:MAG: hypothetical protein M1839_003755 [Geoglossum umbratile]|nr:MAG: hypothetical protein M1839_003755 [Geoglossum umbratile]